MILDLAFNAFLLHAGPRVYVTFSALNFSKRPVNRAFAENPCYISSTLIIAGQNHSGRVVNAACQAAAISLEY